MKKLAFRKALSERIKSGDVFLVDSFIVKEAKTKQFIATIGAITGETKTLIVSTAFDQTTYLAARNVQPALLITAAEVNTEQLLNFRKIVITNEGLAQLSDRIATK